MAARPALSRRPHPAIFAVPGTVSPITLRLRRRAPPVSTMVAYFSTLEAAGQAVVNLTRSVDLPLPALPEMFRRIEQIAASFSTMVATVAHAGDGNVHPLVVFERGNPDSEARARATFESIMEQALALGGTITGEHGVGTLKMAFLERQLEARALEIERGLERLFDPAGILNPGKVFHARD